MYLGDKILSEVELLLLILIVNQTHGEKFSQFLASVALSVITPTDPNILIRPETTHMAL